MKKIFKRAHKMAREIKREYPDVNYRVQFGLCLSYLLNKKEEEKMMIGTKGTERQVKFAQDILNKINEVVSVEEVVEEIKAEIMNSERLNDEKKARKIEKLNEAIQDAGFIINGLKDYFYELKNSAKVTEKLGKDYAVSKVAAGLTDHRSFAKYANMVARKHYKQVKF